MAELEDIYHDVKTWVNFEGETETETIGVYRRCTECGRFIKTGSVLMNRLGEVKLSNWNCKIHGEIQPFWDRW